MNESSRKDEGEFPSPKRRMTLAATLLAVAVSSLGAACSGASPAEDGESIADETTDETAEALGTTESTVGLAIAIENGEGKPLKVKKGQRFYLNQIDMRAFVNTTVNEGVNALKRTGDFKDLPWAGVSLVDQEPLLSQNPDGTFTNRRFYRNALWMNLPSFFIISQADSRGNLVDLPIVLSAGDEFTRRGTDDFFVRRFRAIQWQNNCATMTDCSTATSFQEEALVELRYGEHPNRTFKIRNQTKSIKVLWSLRPGKIYDIPVTQVENPQYAYGAKVDLTAVTPPQANGTYAPGTDITFRVGLKDGAGTLLHNPNFMPSYNEAMFGNNTTGIQYYQAFGWMEPSATYYRRKHLERNMIAQIVGPAQKIKPIRSIIGIGDFLDPSIDVQTTATPSRDGLVGQMRIFPTAVDLFGGGFLDPQHLAWNNPVSTTWKFTIPPDAEAGTYLVTYKARRVYLGEDIPVSKTIEIQVGTKTRTEAVLTTGPCNTCHSGDSSLGNILHANDNRAACASCHAPLGFEYEGPIYVRTHFIHSRSNRYDAPYDKCSSCHLNKASIQRTSKSACLSCHKSYPQSHVNQFGPIESMYVGGGAESFDQCSTSCHTNHKNSGLTL